MGGARNPEMGGKNTESVASRLVLMSLAQMFLTKRLSVERLVHTGKQRLKIVQR